MAKGRIRKILLSILAIVLLGAGAAGYYAYNIFLRPNIILKHDKQFIYIPTGSSFADLQKNLVGQGIIRDQEGFRIVARLMKFDRKVLPGKYEVENRMSNLALVRMLRTGKQIPIDIKFDKIRFKDQVASALGNALECDSAQVMRLLESDSFLSSKGFTRDNMMGMFISNTYRFLWNTSAKQALNRLFTEWTDVWTEHRRDQAEFLNLTPQEVMTLASIVQEETAKKDEAPKVAGVYLNRLKKGMKLEADPTAKYAELAENRDSVIKRVKGAMLKRESPYNTYYVAGLPPGPIVVPAVWAIDAVLVPEKHNYIFFCAKEDFSGYHNFAETAAQHAENARKYHRALNARGIH
jgi:UPF0755 protein